MKQILFITLSNIGDAVMTTPTLERLHQLYPDAVIDLVCDLRSKTLFEHCPYRGEIILKEKKEGKKGLFKLIRQLRKKRYDLIVDLRTDGLAYLLRAKKRLTKFGHQPYGPHAVEDLISIIDKINPDKHIPPTMIWLDKIHFDQANELTSSLPGKKWLGISPGANWQPKIWNAKNFAVVANALAEDIDAVILLGGPGDTQYSSHVASQLEIPLLELTAKTDLLTTTALIQKCCLFLGNDSGLGHLASAVDTPSITVFGPGKPERYHPWHPYNQWLCGETASLDNIKTNAVIKVARQLIETSL
jgi:ADP-heptose:LPS heptosyltransferase